MSERKAMMVGYSFQDACVQIGYYTADMDQPMLLSQSQDSEKYQIPTCLCRLNNSGQWLFGQEAVNAHEEGHGALVEDLISFCYKEDPVLVGDVPYMPVELLTVFIKRSLNLLHRIVNLDQIHAMTFTFPRLSERLIANMKQVMEQLPIPRERLFLQDHKESFYDFVTCQKRELWNNDVLMLDARGGQLYSWELGRIKTGHGVPFTVTETVFDEFQFGEKNGATDARFAQLLEQFIQKRLISSVFLVGKEFEGDWMQESLRFLCRGRRVFSMEDLPVRGACYRGLRPADPRNDRRQFYLGEQQLDYHVGVYVWNGREQQYCRLVWAGTGWFEASVSQVFLLDQCDSVLIQIDLVGDMAEEKKSIRQTIPLDWLPKRPNLATKIRLDIEFQNPEQGTVTVTDLGLGDLFPGSAKAVTRHIGGNGGV